MPIPIRRVLFSESSSNVGGQELQLLTQAEGLNSLGISTQILCRPDSRIAQIGCARSLEIKHVSFRNSLHPPSIRVVHRLLGQFKPDAVICHSGHDSNVCAVAARLMPSRPALLRARTYQPGLPHAWTYNYLFDRTLVPSEELRRNLLRHPKINPERLHVLYPGTDFDAVSAKAELTLPEHVQRKIQALPRRRLVHTAMLRGEKGHLFMLQVLARLISSFPDVSYVIAGEGDMREKIATSVHQLGLGDHVAMLGMVENVPALLAQAEIVVMPSTYEPFGLSQIEALSLGVPVIASRIGGIPETIRDGCTGFLESPEDADAWFNRLTAMLESPVRAREMAAAGRDDVRQRFGLGNNLSALQHHISQILIARK